MCFYISVLTTRQAPAARLGTSEVSVTSSCAWTPVGSDGHLSLGERFLPLVAFLKTLDHVNPSLFLYIL